MKLKTKTGIGWGLLGFFLCSLVTAPALAITNASDISITWLSTSGMETIGSYIEELDWLALWNYISERYSYIELSTGERIDEYDRVLSFSEDLARVGRYDLDGNLKYGYINKDGTVEIPIEFGWASSFSNGLAVIRENTEDGKYGYIDKTGSIVIPVQYDEADSFSQELAVVGMQDIQGNMKYGYIDKAGTIVIPLEYDNVESFSDGLAHVEKNGEDLYIDQTGKIVFNLGSRYTYIWEFSEGMLRVGEEYVIGRNEVEGTIEIGWLEGFVDKTGAVVIPTKYGAKDFSENLAAVGISSTEGNIKYGYIDKTGSEVIPLEYDDADSFSENLAAVGIRNAEGTIKYGYIDKTGTVVIPPKYDVAHSFSEGLAVVIDYDADGNPKCGAIDLNGNVVLPLEYNMVRIGERYCWVQKGISYGFFENPLHASSDKSNADDSIPIQFVLVIMGIATVAIIGFVLILVVKKRKTTPIAASFITSKYCPNCETPLSQDSKFCPNCGKQLNT